MTLSTATYSRAPRSRDISSLTKIFLEEERSWMRVQPPSCFGTRPNDEHTYGLGSGADSAVKRSACNCLLTSAVSMSGASFAEM